MPCSVIAGPYWSASVCLQGRCRAGRGSGRVTADSRQCSVLCGTATVATCTVVGVVRVCQSGRITMPPEGASVAATPFDGRGTGQSIADTMLPFAAEHQQ